jgi:hypothetical protein
MAVIMYRPGVAVNRGAAVEVKVEEVLKRLLVNSI